MAIEVKFTGFVNEVKVFGWGVIAKVSHNQVKKTDDGKWETVGRDYFDVVLPDGVTVSENDRVDVVGRLKTKLYDRKDGGKGMSLEVRAESVAVSGNNFVDRASLNKDVPVGYVPWEPAKPVDQSDIPF
jgi:hypothetical protein